jgi:undecaprenyl diphosphate synthase
MEVFTTAVDPHGPYAWSGTPLIPRHVGIIMDGNGRWAKMRGLPRTAGHAEVSVAMQSVVATANALGVRWLTLFAFSTENWRRPQREVAFLMRPEGWLVTPPQVDWYSMRGAALKFIGQVFAQGLGKVPEA